MRVAADEPDEHSELALIFKSCSGENHLLIKTVLVGLPSPAAQIKIEFYYKQYTPKLLFFTTQYWFERFNDVLSKR